MKYVVNVQLSNSARTNKIKFFHLNFVEPPLSSLVNPDKVGGP